MRLNGTFSTGVHDEYEEDRHRTECAQEDQALEERKSIQDQVVLASQHNVSQRRGTQGASSWEIFTRSPEQQTRGTGHNANAATQQKTSEEVTISKDDLVSVMKRISTSLQEQDSATAPGSGDSMGCSFTAADEHILSASTEDTVKMTMVVDSGASDHYVDGKLVNGIKQLMFDYQEFDSPRTITTAGLHTLLGTATEKFRSKVTDSNGQTRMATLPITIVPRIGRNLFSSGAAQGEGITTITSDNARLEKGNVNSPLRRDGQLFTLELELLPMQTSESTPSALIATNKADTWHRRLGHLNESSMKTLRDQQDSEVSFEGNISPCKTCAPGKSAQGKHPKTSSVTTTTPLELVYTDLAGSSKPNAMGGSQYISKFTDHHTRWKAVYPIGSKDKAIDALSYFIQDYVIPLGARMQRSRCEKGEYTAQILQRYLY